MKYSKRIPITIIAGLLFLTTSCVSKKKMIYFQETEAAQIQMATQYLPKIMAGDVLNITVNALEEEAAAPFNLTQKTGSGGGAKPITYLVDDAGNIAFPVLGTVAVAGLTTNELRYKLIGKLESQIVNPIVTIRMENFRVTVLGEVKNPGAINLTNERTSVTEAIGLAGDLTIQGKRNNVLLIRQTGDTIEKVRLDLTNESLFSSPYYYLAQNDILYIEPNKAKVNSSAIGTTSSLLSIASALLSLILILTR